MTKSENAKSFVCIGAIFIGVYYYRRRDQYDQQPKNERTTADQINGFENNAFHMNDQEWLNIRLKYNFKNFTILLDFFVLFVKPTKASVDRSS